MTTYAKYTVAMTFRVCFTFGILTVAYNWCGLGRCRGPAGATAAAGSHCCCWCWWCTVGAALPQHPTCLLGGTQCITHTQKRCQAVTVTPQKPGLLYWAASRTKATHPSFPASRYFPTILIVLLAVFNDGAMIALSKVRLDCMRGSIDRENRWGRLAGSIRKQLKPSM
jgi:hypothetical protein